MANVRIRLLIRAIACLSAIVFVLGVGGMRAGGQAPDELTPPLLVPPGQAAPTTAAAPGEEQVVRVLIKGQKRVPLAKILPHIHTREGRAYDPEVVEQDVRRLNRTGLFFTAKPYTQKTPDGRIVIFDVLEKPIIDHVWYVGNTIGKKKLAEEALIKPGDAMDLYAIEESRRRIEEYYHAHGYPKARITIVEGSKSSDQGVTFLINEGQRQRILWTGFVGNTIADDGRLRMQVKSKPGVLWFLGGDVDPKEIEEDKNRLTAYYRGLGFMDAKVGREWRATADGKWIYLTYVIDEGRRYVVRNVSVIGNTTYSADQLLGELQLQSGDFYNQNKMKLDEGTLRDTYGAVGYVFADVQDELVYPDEPGRLDLVYRIKEGNRYRVGRIDVQIKGQYPHTRLATVLNRMSLKPGDIVDIRELRASERRLKASGLFAVDPAKGSAPKIVFTAPTAEDLEKREEGVADKPKRPDGFRGQSPDSPADRDSLVNLSIFGEWADNQPDEVQQAQPTPQNPGPSQRAGGAGYMPTTVRGQSPQASSGLLRWKPWASNRPDPTPAAAPPGTAAPDFSWSAPGNGVLPMVTRGQYTDGVSFPSLNTTAGRASSYTQPAEQTQPVATPWSPPAAQPSATTTTTVQQPVAQTTQPQTTQPPAAVAPPAQTVAPAPSYANPYDVSPLGGPYYGRPSATDPLQPPILQDPTNLLGLPPDDQPLFLPLNPLVEETETGKLMFSVGVNSDAGLIGSFVLDEQNFDWTRWPRSWEDIRNATAFRGAGQRFRAEAVPGTQTQRYAVTFQEPYLLDTNVSLGLSAYYYERDYYEWDEQRLGGRVSLGYQFTPDLFGTLAFRGANINISNPIDPTLPDLVAVLGNNALYGFEGRLTHDTRDSTFMPTEGHILEVAFEEVLGSFQYPRAEVDFRQYFMLHERPDGSGRHVLGLSGRVAYTGDNTPIYERYYAGGFSTIRGFEFRGVAPSQNGVLVGGDYMVLASAEYMFPITASDALRGVIFVDTGTVEPSIDDWTDNYRVAPGVGLRITIPAMGPAPIALDLAFPVSKEPTDRTQAFSFFVGFTR